MKDIETRRKKAQRERKHQRDKTQVTFCINQFYNMRLQRKAHIKWMKIYPKVAQYPDLIHWFMNLNSKYRSKELIKLGCIHDYGYKNGRWECPKRLRADNPFWEQFKKLTLKLTREEINRQRAFVRQVFEQIHEETFRCYYTKQKHPRVILGKHQYCQQNIPTQKIDFHIQKLKEFWNQLVGRAKVGDQEEESDDEEDYTPTQNVEDQQMVGEVERQESQVSFLQEWSSPKIQRIPVNQPQERQHQVLHHENREQFPEIPQNQHQLRENNNFKSQNKSRNQQYPQMVRGLLFGKDKTQCSNILGQYKIGKINCLLSLKQNSNLKRNTVTICLFFREQTQTGGEEHFQGWKPEEGFNKKDPEQKDKASYCLDINRSFITPVIETGGSFLPVYFG